MIQKAQSMAKSIAKEKSAKFEELKQLMQRLQVELEVVLFGHQVSILEESEKLKQEYDDYLEKQVKAAAFRGHCNWYEKGERSSKQNFSLEKRNYNAKVLNAIKMDNGNIIRDPKLILQENANCYKKLYGKNYNVKFELFDLPGVKLTKEQAEKAEVKLGLEELTLALHSMADGKTPGCDGLTVEFYKAFWELIKDCYFNAVCFAIQRGHFHLLTRCGIISQIPKKDKDPLRIANWRLLTMLNVDYKIFSKALASRMKVALPDLISTEQTGFLSGCNIATNIRRVIEVMQFAKTNQISCCLLSIDFCKCFDLLDQAAIFQSLQYYGYGPYFVSLVRLLFNNFELAVQNNGYFSKFFSQRAGTHQGCPSAAALYLYQGELVSRLLKNNSNIQGISMYDTKQLLSQFADDTDLFLLYEQATFDAVIKTFDIVERNLGLVVNYDKTSVYHMGSLANSNAQIYTLKPLAWTNDLVNILGVFVSNDMLVSELNYDAVFKAAENILNNWSVTSLSGKIMTVNSLVASLFVYKLQVLPILDDCYVKKYKDLILKYLWSGKKPKIPYCVLTNTRESGGLHLCDIRSRDFALKCQWLNIVKQDVFFSRIANNMLGGYGRILWYANLQMKHVRLLFPESFWRNVLEAWSEFNYSRPSCPARVLQQVLWFNSDVCINKKPCFFQDAYSAGVVHVADLFDSDTGSFLSYQDVINKFPHFFTWYNYNQILSTLQSYKTLLKQNESGDTYTYNIVRIERETKICNLVYSELIDNVEYVAKYHRQWEVLLKNRIEFKDYITGFKNIVKITIATKFRDFQYQLMLNKIFTNDVLFVWGKVDSVLCSFCSSETDGIVHMLFECSKVRPVWSNLKRYAKANGLPGANQIIFTPHTIIFNTVNVKPQSAISLLTLVTKQQIYSCKCTERVINLFDFNAIYD